MKATGRTLGSGERTLILEHAGVKVGLMGLIEREWLATLSTMEESELEWRCVVRPAAAGRAYHPNPCPYAARLRVARAHHARRDYVDVARELSAELRSNGAEVVIALTHMRLPNDRRLMDECCAPHAAVVDLILGGHDHDYSHVSPSGEAQPRLVKSGTDFRELADVVLEVGGANDEPESAGGASEREVRVASVRRVQVAPDAVADPRTEEIVASFEALVGEKMSATVGTTAVPLDARFATIRSSESNVSNFVVDLLREGAGADLALLNSGTLRADRVFPAGRLTMRDLVSLLPMADETVVLQLSGADLLAALENGVGQYPRLDGRWPCVSQIRFAFDPAKPSGQRIVAGSVFVASAAAAAARARRRDGRPSPLGTSLSVDEGVRQRDPSPVVAPEGFEALSLTDEYTLATKAYLSHGKDGYTAFKGCKVVVDPEEAPMLPGLVRNHFVERAAAAGFRQKGVFSPAKLAKSRTVRTAAAVTPANKDATPRAARTPRTDAPPPLAPASATSTNRQSTPIVTPQGPERHSSTATPLAKGSVHSERASPACAADPMEAAICPALEGRIVCNQ